MEGIKTLASAFGPKDTMDRLEAAVRANGLTVFARIDHAAGATEVGLSLRPTELLIFGNARAGTPLMQAKQTIGIDLPLKALVWRDASGKTWLSYNDVQWIVSRYERRRRYASDRERDGSGTRCADEGGHSVAARSPGELRVEVARGHDLLPPVSRLGNGTGDPL